MQPYEETEIPAIEEMDDEQLNQVVGGVEIGQTIQAKSNYINYCPRCARLLLNYTATVTGIRGYLDGHALYWITRDCCGYKTSIIDTDIVG